MKLQFSNIGPLKGGEVNLNDDLIVLCGTNNTGKTYLAYTIFGIYKYFKVANIAEVDGLDTYINRLQQDGNVKVNLLEELTNDLDIFLKGISDFTLGNLPNIFALEEGNEMFKNAIINLIDFQNIDYALFINESTFQKRIKIGQNTFTFFKSKDSYILEILLISEKVDKLNNSDIVEQFLFEELLKREINREICNIILGILFQNVYIAPAERTAINLFSNELSIKRSALFDDLSAADLKKKKVERYAFPIRESLKIAGDLSFLQKQTSKYKYLADILEKEILKGKMKVSKEGEVLFSPHKVSENLDIHLTASIVKSLSSLVFYFRHLAQEKDFIIIDEPELNLHPDNQRKVARFLGRLVNEGFKVMISTHSDYIIREFNNLIMLKSKNGKAAKLIKEFGYNKEELLDFNKIGVYLVKPNVNVEKIEVTNTGFEIDSIDAEINSLNESAEKIYYTLYGQ